MKCKDGFRKREMKSATIPIIDSESALVDTPDIVHDGTPGSILCREEADERMKVLGIVESCSIAEFGDHLIE